MRALRGATARLSLLIAATAVVCLAQVPANPGNSAARVTTLTGQVSVLRDSGQWALSIGDLVQMQQLIVSGPDGHAIFQVYDGSTFEVFPNSRVVFRKNTSNQQDLIDVILGRVRVIIEHLGLTPNHNRIVTPTAVISVRGTIFDITVNEDEETSTLVEVEEGLVEVQHALQPYGKAVALHQGESIRVWKNIPIARNGVDKPALFQRILRAVFDAASTYGSRRPSVAGVGGGTAGGGAAGDTGKKIPPPPPPPPPPLKP
ncbi:MAG TPA: FecR family protein [Bryobacteraceae bacterium]|nr:FecR family protein [Bryobacteraceae bacterium]